MLTVRVVPHGNAALRSGLAAVAVTTGLVAAHVAAGGMLPSVPWVLAMAAAVFVTGLGVLTRRVTLKVGLPALLALQLSLHVVLALLAPVHGMSAGAIQHGGGDATGPPGQLMSWPMLLAHAAAAVVTAALWELGEWAVDVVVVWTDGELPPVRHRRRQPDAAGRSRPARGREVLLAAPRRGPPAAATPL